MSAPKKDALVKRAPTPPVGPAPPMVLARSLEQAEPRTFVHVDDKGRVRSPARYRALEAISYGAVGALAVLATALYGSMLGIPGVGIGLGLTALMAWQIRRGRKLQKATRLLVHDRLDEAEQLLTELLKSFRLSNRLR